MTRTLFTLLALIAATAAAAALHADTPQQLTPAATVPPAAQAATADAIDLVGFDDLAERMTVPVSIGASGPYPFIIDTGAERTVVSIELAGTLKLAAGRRVNVISMAGQGSLPTFLVPELRVSRIAHDSIVAPGVDAKTLGAAGMIGIDALKGHSVSIDFDKNIMEVRTSTKRSIRLGDADIVIRAKNVYGQLIVTDARYRGRRISVVIDTGSPVTIGNLALLKRVQKNKSMGPINMLAVTGQWLKADYRVIDNLSIAGIDFNNVPIAFADAEPFRRFGLGDTPALMLGMDSLRLFRRVQIDFANREIRFTLPRGAVGSAPLSRTFF